MVEGAADDEVRARRDLFRYVTAPEAPEYMAVMGLFTSSLLADLSAAEVSERLQQSGSSLTVDETEARCAQLLEWGNLVRSVRDTRVATVADYLRSRARYQPSKLGGMVHRQVEELLAEVGGVREVARELLGGMVATLRTIVEQAKSQAADPEQLAGDVSRLFADHQLFADSVSQFYGYLPQVLVRYDLAGEEYSSFKTLLTDYVHLVSEDVSRHAPRLAGLLAELTPALPTLLGHLAPITALANVDGSEAKRSPGRIASDWTQMTDYYAAPDGRSVPAQLRAATDAALNQLLANAKRMLAAAGTGVSRHGDLLTLARWFAQADPAEAHRIFDATFGMFPARHLSGGPDEDEISADGPATSWWVASPVDVAVSLRERGDRAARGRTAAVLDPGLEADRLQELAAAEARARAAATHELVAAGALHGAHLSPAARDLLLEQLATALGTGLVPDVPNAAAVAVDLELGLELTITAAPGLGTVVTSSDGRLVVDDLRLHVAQTDVGGLAAVALEAR